MVAADLEARLRWVEAMIFQSRFVIELQLLQKDRNTLVMKRTSLQRR